MTPTHKPPRRLLPRAGPLLPALAAIIAVLEPRAVHSYATLAGGHHCRVYHRTIDPGDVAIHGW